MDKFNGYKTYFVVAAMVAFAIAGLYLGRLDGNQAIGLIMEAAAIAGLRHAVANK